MNDEFGGYWTQAKLVILDKYLKAFNTAAKNAGPTAYFDLFAGKLNNKLPITGAPYEGSTGVALRTSPGFSKLIYWELGNLGDQLRDELSLAFPGDRRYEVVRGDCNIHLLEGLNRAEHCRRSPSFAFIDPKGLDVQWKALEILSEWRKDRQGRKVELWILLPEPAIARMLGLRGVRGRRAPQRLTDLFGCHDWMAINELRRTNQLDPAQARAEYVNLYRWRIEKKLGYRWTHALQLDNDGGSPVYTMIFATCSNVGNDIMRDIYQTACVREIPELLARSISARTMLVEESSGVQRLFTDEMHAIQPEDYVYVPTWEPLSFTSPEVTFEDDAVEDQFWS